MNNNYIIGENNTGQTESVKVVDGGKLSVVDFDIQHAISIIKDTYGVDVSVELKKKDLLKFGESRFVQTTKSTLMELPSGVYNETYVNRNIIDTVSSSSASDTGKISIEGHTVGNDITVTDLSQVGGTASAQCSGVHLFNEGDWVYIEGAADTEYNGIVQVTAVPAADIFEYEVDSSAASPTSGTITATNQEKTFLVQTVQLDGQNKVTLPTPLARQTKMYIPSQNKAVNLVGDVYGYEDTAIVSGVPTDGTKVHCMVTGSNENNNSLKASTSISNQDFWIVRGMQAHLLEKTAATADVALEIREVGGVFLEKDKVSVSGGSEILKFKPYIIVPQNADVRLRARAGTSNKYIGGSIEGYLAKVI